MVWVMQGEYVEGRSEGLTLRRQISHGGVVGAHEGHFNSICADRGVENKPRRDENKGRHRLLCYPSQEEWSSR